MPGPHRECVTAMSEMAPASGNSVIAPVSEVWPPDLFVAPSRGPRHHISAAAGSLRWRTRPGRIRLMPRRGYCSPSFPACSPRRRSGASQAAINQRAFNAAISAGQQDMNGRTGLIPAVTAPLITVFVLVGVCPGAPNTGNFARPFAERWHQAPDGGTLGKSITARCGRREPR